VSRVGSCAIGSATLSWLVLLYCTVDSELCNRLVRFVMSQIVLVIFVYIGLMLAFVLLVFLAGLLVRFL